MAQSQDPYGRRMESDPLRDAANQAEDAAGTVAQQAQLAGEGFQEVAGNFRSALDKSLRDQPTATLASAAIAGFVLGAIWKT